MAKQSLQDQINDIEEKSKDLLESKGDKQNVITIKIGYSSYLVDGGIESTIGFLKFLQDTPLKKIETHYECGQSFNTIDDEDAGLNIGVNSKRIVLVDEETLITLRGLDKKKRELEEKLELENATE